MKTLVTGADGQLAGEIIKVMKAAGHDVLALTRSDLDISSHSDVMKTTSDINPDCIINCAAYNEVDKAEDDWQQAFLINGIGVKNLAIAARKHNAVLVHFSTDFVFDGLSSKPYTIADMPSPISSYGQSKLFGEEMVREHAERYYLIRTSWLFGEGKFSFPKKVIEWASEKSELKVVDDQVSTPTYAADLALAVLDLIGTESFGLYHISNSGQTSRYEWAKYILELTGWKGEVLPACSDDFDMPAKRPAYSVLDSFPLESAIGRAMPSWQDATSRFLSSINILK